MNLPLFLASNRAAVCSNEVGLQTVFAKRGAQNSVRLA